MSTTKNTSKGARRDGRKPETTALTVTNAAADASPKDSLLMAGHAPVVVRGETTLSPALIFFDPGSQLSFIREGYRRMIKPPKLGERNLEIGTFMGTPHRLHSGCYQLGIKCKDGSTEYIAAQQVKHIAKPITTATATTTSRLTHARITAEPDILVGVSDFWRFFKGVTEIAPSQ